LWELFLGDAARDVPGEDGDFATTCLGVCNGSLRGDAELCRNGSVLRFGVKDDVDAHRPAVAGRVLVRAGAIVLLRDFAFREQAFTPPTPAPLDVIGSSSPSGVLQLPRAEAQERVSNDARP